MNKVVRRSLLAASLLALIFAGAAQADALINFDQVGSVNGGALNYFGGGGRLAGTRIQFDAVVGYRVPQNSGSSLDCTNCYLNFLTGNLQAGSGSNGTFTFNGGENTNFRVTGAISDRQGNCIAGDCENPYTTLLQGSFQGLSTATITGDSLTFQAAGIDTKDADLLSYLGIDPDAAFNYNFNASSSNVSSTISGFKAALDSADLVNATAATSVPEPSGLFMLGAGLFGLTFLTRRKSRKLMG